MWKERLVARVEIRGEQHPIGEVFSERYAFEVPPYQRSYAWTTEHAGELLADLLDYLDDGTGDVDELNPYFLGSVVLIKGDRPEAQIVDGQQRLITLTILLAVLRSLVPAEFAESITRRIYEPPDPLNNIPPRYRVRPKERDVVFLQQFVQSEGGIERLRGQVHVQLSESQRNIRDNAFHFVRELSELPVERRVRLAQFIVQRCLLIVVTTPDLDSAYRIFSVMNNRGLDLTTADILKAEVIGQIPESLQQQYTERWEDLEEKLGVREFSDFFSHLRTIYRKAQAQSSILDEFRKYVVTAAADAQHLVDDIVIPLGSAYSVVKLASYEHSDEETTANINALLRWLGQIDNADWIPPAMIYLSRYHDEPARLVRFFTMLERLAASLMIRRQYAHRRIPRYHQVLRAIERGDDLSKPGSPIQLSQQERDEAIGVLGSDLYLMPPKPRNYVLKRLDSSLAGAGAVYDHKDLTVEHVLPRNPLKDSEWTSWFPTQSDRSRWVHRLGNLALLTRAKNREAYNYSFATKKRKYFATKDGVSPFALTTQVLQEDEWTPQVV
ncbi:MAG TPA: DUF262 domain-containing HNH endonuclease family protein, partial [Gemmatimonadaceae bacterium]